MERVEVTEIRQKPTIISLEDGTEIELSVHVVEVQKTGEVDCHGKPIYEVRHRTIMHVRSEEQAAQPADPKVSLH